MDEATGECRTCGARASDLHPCFITQIARGNGGKAWQVTGHPSTYGTVRLCCEQHVVAEVFPDPAQRLPKLDVTSSILVARSTFSLTQRRVFVFSTSEQRSVQHCWSRFWSRFRGEISRSAKTRDGGPTDETDQVFQCAPDGKGNGCALLYLRIGGLCLDHFVRTHREGRRGTQAPHRGSPVTVFLRHCGIRLHRRLLLALQHHRDAPRRNRN